MSTVRIFLLSIFAFLVCVCNRADGRNADPSLINTLPDADQNAGESCFSNMKFICFPEYRYRMLNGECTSLEVPTRGMSETAFTRLLPANYRDNKKALAVQSDGREFPSARVLSNMFFSDLPDDDPQNLDKQFTLSTMIIGQLATHDMVRTTGKPGPSCCTTDRKIAMNPPDNCIAIPVPFDDSYYSKFNTTCLNFRRSLSTEDDLCGLSPILPINLVTSYLDASPLYGSTEQANRDIRLFQGGLLKFQIINGSIYPPNVNDSSGLCIIDTEPKLCLQSGDTVRTNSHPMLALLQTIMLRFHNKIANELGDLNPNWTDDSLLFEEARRIVIACLQQIVFQHFLPNLVGNEYLQKVKCGLVQNTGYNEVYDSTVNPQILTEFSANAFRSLHSCIVDRVRMYDETRMEVGHWNFSDFFNSPGFIAQGDNFEDLIRGVTKDPQGNLDRFFTTSITDLLFQVNGLGADLESIDIEKSRDQGIRSHVDYLVMIGQPRPQSWEDYKQFIEDVNMFERLKEIYASFADVELFIGGILERDSPGSQIGPTFQAIITEQFCRLQLGDRFYFERKDQPQPFTEPQLEQIRKVTLSLIYCFTCPKLKDMQPDAFRLYSENNNPIPCSKIIGDFTLKPWKQI